MPRSRFIDDEATGPSVESGRGSDDDDDDDGVIDGVIHDESEDGDEDAAREHHMRFMCMGGVEADLVDGFGADSECGNDSEFSSFVAHSECPPAPVAAPDGAAGHLRHRAVDASPVHLPSPVPCLVHPSSTCNGHAWPSILYQ